MASTASLEPTAPTGISGGGPLNYGALRVYGAYMNFRGGPPELWRLRRLWRLWRLQEFPGGPPELWRLRRLQEFLGGPPELWRLRRLWRIQRLKEFLGDPRNYSNYGA